jgi:hypothetical protein
VSLADLQSWVTVAHKAMQQPPALSREEPWDSVVSDDEQLPPPAAAATAVMRAQASEVIVAGLLSAAGAM